MPTIRINAIDNFLSFTPFPQTGPGASVRMRSVYFWTPVDRDDLPDQKTSVPETVQAGHPAAAAVLNLQTAATNLLNARLSAIGQNLTTTPVSKLNVWWSYPAPFDNAVAKLVRWQATANPVEYPEIVITLSGENTINPGSGIIADLESIYDAAKLTAAARYPGFTITEPVPEVSP
jgi:hypothetical protein